MIKLLTNPNSDFQFYTLTLYFSELSIKIMLILN